jgi:sialidase-1
MIFKLCTKSLPLHLTILLIAPVVPLFATEPPPGPIYAWYHEDGIKAQGAMVSAWENVVANNDRADRTLNRVFGTPQSLRVQTPSGIKTVVRFNGSAALWQAVGSWGTLRGERTVAVFARMPTEKSGTLFDGSTRVGSTPVKWKNGKWESSARNDSTTNLGDWQVHTFRFNAEDKPLGGFILGANVATQEGLTCDVGEVLIYPRTLNDLEITEVVAYLQTKWGVPKELPAELQPQTLRFFSDPRVFRTTIRKQGQDGVHTYRIPGLATTNKGTLIAVFDMRHQNGGDLPANIDVGMMRSTDDGATWSPVSRIIDFDKEVPESRGNGVGDPAILVDRQTGTIFVAALWSKGNRAWNGSGPGMSPDETGQLVIVKSVDDGMTWSTPINITSQVKDPAWRLCFNGPGSGIQLRDGTLVFAAQFKGPDNVPHSCFIASEDHGNRWRISPPAVADSPPTSESAVVELANGSLLLSMRNESHAGVRVWSRWDWKENIMQGNWSDKWLTVTDPTCMASLIRHPHGELIFSNPNNAQKRVALTIRTSTDDGQTWSVGRLLDPNGAMYSSLSILRDGQIGVLYESVDEAGLVFARFPLDWLLEGASVPNVPEARTETTGKFGWWPARHAAKVAETKANRGNASLRVMFFGDSITQGWENAGKEAWEQHFAKFTPANYGFGGDSTQHVLWRVLNGECDEIAPKAIVLLIGTNNVRHGDFTPEQIADGIGAILAALEKKCPKSKVLLLGILPRGPDKSDLLRQKVDAVNALLPTLADNRRVHYLNVNSKLLNADGTLSQSIAPDLLHLSAEGYGILAEQIETKLQELMANE